MIIKIVTADLTTTPTEPVLKYSTEEVAIQTEKANKIRERLNNGEPITIEDQRELVLYQRMKRTTVFQLVKIKEKPPKQPKAEKPKKLSKFHIDESFEPIEIEIAEIKKLQKKYLKDKTKLTWNELKLLEFNLSMKLMSKEDYLKIHQVGE